MKHVFMLGFNTCEMIEEAFQNYETFGSFEDVTLTFYDCSYPLPNAQKNSETLKLLCHRYHWTYKGMENKGVTENWAQAFRDLNPNPNDTFIGFDPDCRLSPKGWVEAMHEVLQTVPDAVCVMAARSYHDEEWCYTQHGRTIFTLPSKLRVASYRQLIAWSICGYRSDWLRFLLEKHGTFLAYNKVYGYSEHWQAEQQRKHGKRWFSLVDFYDDHQKGEGLYTQWKLESAQKKTEVKFEDWLKNK